MNDVIELGVVVARDEAGRTFDKAVLLHPPSLHRPRPILDLGLYEWYAVADLAAWLAAHPGTAFCLDAHGRNHAGSPVWIGHSDLARLVRQVERLLEEP